MSALLFGKMNLKINKRLLCAASFVSGNSIADIGTDHAYLPLHLVLTNKVERALACDINEGPCQRAKENVELYNCSHKIDILCTDGLQGVEGFAPDNITICGMGGELICRIIENSSYVKEAAPHLILQAMTKVPELRAYLLTNGYKITNEALVHDDRLYEVICATYDGKKREWTPIQLLCGKRNLENKDPLLKQHIEKHISQQKTIINGKKKAGLCAEEEEALMKSLEGLLK